MNALDFWDVTVWREILQCIRQREPFQVERNYSRIKYRLKGYSISADASYRPIWKGSYLVHIEVETMKGNYQGGGFATDDLTKFGTYEKFIRLTDRLLEGFQEEYTPLPTMIIPVEQLALL